jgi:ribose transport system ATP-binding protein
MQEYDVVLECRHIYKRFSKNTVLKDINLSLNRGEVHALLGQNGAGKSTLVKIITGVYTLDSGDVLVNGEVVSIRTPADAEKLGIAIIHQDQQLVPYFDVTRNAFLGIELKTKSGLLDFKRMKRLVEEKLAYIHADFTADRQISTLTVGQREQVAIISALLQDPRILILDEPTASLSNVEIDRLFEIIDILRKNKVTILYISHHLDEIFRITDRITILRDSEKQGTLITSEATHHQIVTMMIGRELNEFYPKEAVPIGDVLLDVKDLSQGKLVHDITFDVRQGEIVGFAGLVGSGRTETMLTLFGANRKSKGDIILDQQPFNPRSPIDARNAGIAFIPEDRRNEGIVSNMNIAQNLSLAKPKLWSKGGLISRKLEQFNTSAIVETLKIACVDPQQSIMELSGGNQQKVVIGKWMTGESKVFIFDQPTTGVDVGAKTEIYKQMINLASKGCGILFISSEFEELIGICDRILVMHKGHIVKSFQSGHVTEQELLFWAAGAETVDQKTEGGQHA